MRKITNCDPTCVFCSNGHCEECTDDSCKHEVTGTVLDQPSEIEAYRLLALRAALELETKGLRFSRRQRTVADTIRGIMKVTTRKKADLLVAYNAYLAERGIRKVSVGGVQ